MDQNVPEPRPATTASGPPAAARSSSHPRLNSRPQSSGRPRSSSPPVHPQPSSFSDDDDMKHKTKAMVSPARKPGAMTIDGLDSLATVQAVESDLMIKQRALAGRPPDSKPSAEGIMESDAIIKQRVAATQASPARLPGATAYFPGTQASPARLPGATAYVPGTQASPARLPGATAYVPGTQASPARLPGATAYVPATHASPVRLPGAESGLDAQATGQAVESDLTIKQRAAAGRVLVSRPGAEGIMEPDAIIKPRVSASRASPVRKPGDSAYVPQSPRQVFESGLDAQATVAAVESDLMIKQRAAAGRVPASKPGAEGLVESDAIIKQRVAASRDSPARRPGATAHVPQSPRQVFESGLDAQVTVAAVESDLMIKQRAAAGRVPASKPGAEGTVESDAIIKQRVAASRDSPVRKPGDSAYVPRPPLQLIQPGGAESGAIIKQRAYTGRPPSPATGRPPSPATGRPPSPASRPGTSVDAFPPMENDETGPLATTCANRTLAVEPGAAATTAMNRSGLSNDNKKAPSVPASKPGAVSMLGECPAATVQGVEADVLTKQLETSVIKQPFSKPGVVAISGLDRSLDIALVAAKEQDESDLIAKQRARRDPSGHSLTSAAKLSDPDLVVKQRVSGPSPSRPGARNSLTMEDSLAVMQTVDWDTAIKQRARESSSGVLASSLCPEDYVAALQTVNSDVGSKQRVSHQFSTFQSSSQILDNAEAIVALHDSDLASKQHLKSSLGCASAPGALQDLGPPSTKTREQLEATMERMELEQGVSEEKISFAPSSVTNTFTIGDDLDEEYGLNPISKMLEVGNTKFFMDEAGEKQEKDVIEATQIDEEAERELLPGAEAFNPNKGRYQHIRPGFVALVLCLVCVCMAAIVSGAIVVSLSESDDNVPAVEVVSVPTVSPTPSPTSSDEQYLRDYLTSLNISQVTLDQAPVAYDMAVHWCVNVDPGRNLSIDGSKYPWDLSRFVMAWFYYATSSNGTRPWASCNPPDYSRGENDTCTWLQFESASDDRSYVNYQQVPDTARWLSRFDVTSWAGLSTYGNIFDPEDPEQAEGALLCNNQLHRLDLLSFGMSGPLPYMLNLLPCMAILSIGWEPDLTGSLTAEFFNFGTTQFFFTSFQLINTTGVSGTIPDLVWDLPYLQELVIGDTNISGSLPDLFFAERYANLQSLEIFGNHFDDIPLPVINGYPDLFRLRLQRNGFTGQIPSDYAYLPELEELWLFENRLTGPIPETFLDAANMTIFRVDQNQLNGTFPDVLWSFAEEIQLQNNQFEGPLPVNLVNMTDLKVFTCGKNNFNGTLDPAIGDNLLLLEYLELRENKFSGRIPESLANIKTLKVLALELNNFEGELPPAICYLRSRDGLAFITSDCLGYPPQNDCFCCTSCCSTRTGSCEATNIEIDF